MAQQNFRYPTLLRPTIPRLTTMMTRMRTAGVVSPTLLEMQSRFVEPCRHPEGHRHREGHRHLEDCRRPEAYRHREIHLVAL